MSRICREIESPTDRKVVGRAISRYKDGIVLQLDLDHASLRGMSVGGVYTTLHVPQLHSLFDVGQAPRVFAGARRLFLSHAHADHAGALMTHLGHRHLSQCKEPLKLFCPAEIVEPIRSYIHAIGTLQRRPFAVQVLGMEAGQSLPLDEGSRFVKALRGYHSVPVRAYAIGRRVKKLRPPFTKFDGPTIARLKAERDDLFEEVERYEFAYATDTLVQVLDHAPELLDAHTLVLESTFLDTRRSVAECRERCHIHFDEIRERATQFRNRHLVLMHFSQHYSPAAVHRILAERCPETLRGRLLAFAPSQGTWP